MSSCWLEACVFLSSSRSSRSWSSSRSLQRRNVVWSSSSSSRTSRRRNRRGIGESSMFPALASGAKNAPERVRPQHRHCRHHPTSSVISVFEGPRLKRLWVPQVITLHFNNFYNALHYSALNWNMYLTAWDGGQLSFTDSMTIHL